MAVGDSFPAYYAGEGAAIQAAAIFRPFDATESTAYKGVEQMVAATAGRAALARGNREPGQALTGAALSGVLLCGGRSTAGGDLFRS